MTILTDRFALRSGRPFRPRLEGRSRPKPPAGVCFETAAGKMRPPQHEPKCEGLECKKGNLQICRTPKNVPRRSNDVVLTEGSGSAARARATIE